jgi:tRNA pseudouridine55 synthase
MKSTNSRAPVHGIFLLDKPQGITSNSALQKVKRLFNAQKAGHTGSLDPLATGMLPICFGEATKMSQYLLDADKRYQARGLLGIKTDTADSTGTVVSKVSDYSISKERLLEVLTQFKGLSEQVPSMFSALKHQGIPLYQYARKGVKLERKARAVLISRLDLDAFDGHSFDLTVACSKGTYIRNLVEDVGDALGVGAHVTGLRRLHTAGFESFPMVQLDELEDLSMDQRLSHLIPMDKAVVHFPRLDLSVDEVQVIQQGRIISGKLDNIEAKCLRLYDEKGQFMGLGEQEIKGELKAKRLLSFTSLGRMSAFE